MHITAQESVQIIEVKWLELKHMDANISGIFTEVCVSGMPRVLYPGSNNDSCAFWRRDYPS